MLHVRRGGCGDLRDDSRGFEDTYGLDSFDGRATLVALFNAGCYRQGQAQNLDRMHRELRTMGIDAILRRERFAVRAVSRPDHRSMPPAFFQDTEEINAIEQMGGAIYDMFVYRPDGTLHVFLEEAEKLIPICRWMSYANVARRLSRGRGEPRAPNQDMDDQNDGGLELMQDWLTKRLVFLAWVSLLLSCNTEPIPGIPAVHPAK